MLHDDDYTMQRNATRKKESSFEVERFPRTGIKFLIAHICCTPASEPKMFTRKLSLPLVINVADITVVSLMPYAREQCDQICRLLC